MTEEELSTNVWVVEASSRPVVWIIELETRDAAEAYRVQLQDRAHREGLPYKYELRARSGAVTVRARQS